MVEGRDRAGQLRLKTPEPDGQGSRAGQSRLKIQVLACNVQRGVPRVIPSWTGHVDPDPRAKVGRIRQIRLQGMDASVKGLFRTSGGSKPDLGHESSTDCGVYLCQDWLHV